MSTKIYAAYRLPNDAALWPTLWSIKATGLAEARERLARVYRDVLDGRAQALAVWRAKEGESFSAFAASVGVTDPVSLMILASQWRPPAELGPRPVAALAVTDATIMADIDGEADARPSLLDVDQWVRKRYGDQLASMSRNRFALDVSIAVRFDGRFAYLIPYCESTSLVGDSLEFLDHHQGLEIYGYWDNFDRPDDVTARTWGQRRKAWERMIDRWSDFVRLDIVDWHGFHEVSPTAMLAAEYKGREV